MKNILLPFIFSIAIFYSLILKSESSDFAIEKNFTNGLIKYDDVLDYPIGKVICCNISEFKSSKMVFTVKSDNFLYITCYQSSSNQVDNFHDLNKIEIETTTFPNINSDIVIAELNNTKENPFLYVYISNSNKNKINFTLLMTDKENYKTEYKTEELLIPSAYVAYKMDYLELYEKTKEDEFLLSITKGEISIFMYQKEQNNFAYSSKIFNKFFPINQKSLTFLFQPILQYNEYKFILFIGVEEYLENDKITIMFSHMEQNIKLYFYSYEAIYKEFFNFYYDCPNNNTEHYLFIYFGDLDANNETYYFKFHNLIGSEAKFAQISNEINNINDYNYSTLDIFNYFSLNENKMHIIKFQCSGEGNKILANIKYGKKEKETELVYLLYNRKIYDIPFTFDNNNKLVVNYSNTEGYEFDVQIFTPNGEKNISFDITFENNKAKVINDKSYIFTRTDNSNFTTFTIESNENIESIISIIIGNKLEKVINPENKYLTLHYSNYRSDYTTYYYEIEHEFNTNYNIDFELNNRNNYLNMVCYHITNVPLIYLYAQNCILIDSLETKNISIHNIFKYYKDDDYNYDNQKKYYLVVNYFVYFWQLDIFKDIYFNIDLPLSQSINNTYNGHKFQYLDALLEKNVPSYFNIDLLDTKKENNINLYIINKKETNYDELQFNIKCIIKYEPYLDAIIHYFEESDNHCFIINNEDYNSDLYHIIYNDTKQEKHEKLIIRIISKSNMNIKLMIDKSKTISNEFYYNKEIKPIEDSFVHQIYELNKIDISSISNNYRIIYNKHYNGLGLYARNDYDFKLIKKGSIIPIKKDEFLEEYDNYSKFLLIIGQDNYDNFEESFSTYQIIDKNKINYYYAPEFKGYYRIPVLINPSSTMTLYDLIFDYGKQYLKNNIYFINYTLFGYSNIIYYYPELEDTLFGFTNNTIKNFEIINDNKQHLILIRYMSPNDYEGYFDFISEIDYSSEIIYLNRTTINHYIIPKNKNYTFNYEKTDIIKIELLNATIKPVIYFENEIKNFDNDNIITLKKMNSEHDLFYIATPSNLAYSNIPIRLTTYIDIENLEKTNLPNLYKYDGKYIYNYQPKNIYRVTFKFKHKLDSLRFLNQETKPNSGINICYNIAKMIILEEKGNNCFILEDTKEIIYGDNFGYEMYFTFYSEDGNDAFIIEQINEIKKEKNEPIKDDNDNTLIIVLIVVVVVLLILIGIIIFYKFKYKQFTSEDIENKEKLNNFNN